MEERIATGQMAPRNDRIVDVPMRERRSLATVTAEIRTIRAARDKMFLEASVEIGRRLKEAKELVGHGGWGDYCKTELDFSQQTAQNHIRLFEAYAAEQIRLDGAALKSKAFGDLSYTQALALLALPSEEEREAFVASHDLGSMSTRELREELRRRTEDPSSVTAEAVTPSPQGEGSAGEGAAPRLSLQEIEEARETKLRLIRAESRARDAEAERDRIIRETEESRGKAEAAERRAQEADEQLKQAQKELKQAQKKLTAAEKNPKIPKATMDKLKAEAEEAAKKGMETDQAEVEQARAKVAQAEEEAASARREAEAAAKSLAALQKELRLAAPEMAAFRVRFEAAQEALNKAVDALWNLPSDKVDGGVRAIRALLDGVGKRLDEERYEAAMLD